MRVVLITAFVLTIAPVYAADEDDWFNVKPTVHGKTQYYDFNEPMRRAERQRAARAMAAVKNDEIFDRFFQSAVWYPPARQWHDIALGGPYAQSWMYGVARTAQRRKDLQPPEPLPEDMRAKLAERYTKYKRKLIEHIEYGFQPDDGHGQGTGRFQLSATMTEFEQAKTELAQLAGIDAVQKLEGELYVKLRKTPSVLLPAQPSGEQNAPAPKPAKSSYDAPRYIAPQKSSESSQNQVAPKRDVSDPFVPTD